MKREEGEQMIRLLELKCDECDVSMQAYRKDGNKIMVASRRGKKVGLQTAISLLRFYSVGRNNMDEEQLKISPPGDTIVDLLEERGWTRGDFAKRMDQTTKYIDLLLNGREPITKEIAIKLEDVLGSTETFWLNREAQYRKSLKEQIPIKRGFGQGDPICALDDTPFSQGDSICKLR
jgi:HTH-type transcriptional regulator/antitoxin HigA